LSKALAPGLRVGYLTCPSGRAHVAAEAVRTTAWMPAPLPLLVASVWLEDGTARHLRSTVEHQDGDHQRGDIASLSDQQGPHSKIQGREQAYNALPKAMKVQTPKPPWEQLILRDVTVESAGDLMADNPRGMLMVRDEASAWLGDMNRYRAGGRGSDRQFHPKTWDGGDETVNRIGRGHVQIDNASQSFLGAFSPTSCARR
jgi:uncharacterized protein DUF3987